MNIDEREFEYTAKAVFIMNDSARERYDSWEDLKSFMISMAYTYCYESNSFSTSGFCLTAYSSLDGKERFVRASVMAYVACNYAEKTQLGTKRIKELAAVL
jgi:hypothetical protein